MACHAVAGLVALAGAVAQANQPASMASMASTVTAATPVATASLASLAPTNAGAAAGVAIRRTDYGIPHIEASDWTGLGLGTGYAQAADNLCTLAELFATLRGTRSSYVDLARPPRTDSILGRPPSLDLDFFFKLIMTPDRLAAYRDAQRPELRALVDGYARGYDRYVAEIRAGREPSRHQSCRRAAWLTPIDGDDVYRRMIELSLAGGSARFITALAHAEPPPGRNPAAASIPSISAASELSAATLQVGGAEGIGSNALALGALLTDNGRALLFGNPHWYWEGPDRFYQAQLTIAGKLDVAGAMFLGVPVVVIGFNEHVAWTHTVSAARRFGLFRLKLVEGEPTRYWFDGRRESLSEQVISVEVRGASGALHSVSRRFYQSRLGMPIDLSALSGKLKWSASEAFVLDDVNLTNRQTFDNYLGWAQSHSLTELIAVQRRYAAVPWANTLAIGVGEPRVWFGDVGPVPGVSDALIQQCGVSVDDRRWRTVGARVPVLDGSRSACEWQSAADSVQPRTLGLGQLPQLLTRDYAANMNGSYWLSDPAEPLQGLPTIVGAVGEVQTLRTRLGHQIVSARLDGTDGYPGRRFNTGILQQRVLDSTSMSAALFKTPLLDAVCRLGSATISHDPLTGAPLIRSRQIDLTTACAVLARWHNDGNAEARGANLWDAFWKRIDTMAPRELFKIPFDPRAPLATPAQLDADNPRIVEAFALTVAAALEGGEALDETRGARLYLEDGESRLALYGGCAAAGYFTVACPSHEGVRPAGMGGDAHGNSYLQIVSFAAGGVDAYTLLSTSESDDPASPHYRDASRLYASKRWLKFSFEHEQIERGSTADSVVLGP